MTTCALDFTLPDFQNPDGSPKNPFKDGFGVWGQQARQNTSNLHVEKGPGGGAVIVYDIRWEAKCVGDCPSIDDVTQECSDETWEGIVKLKIDMEKAFPPGGSKDLDDCLAGLRKCANNEYNYLEDTRRVSCMSDVMDGQMGDQLKPDGEKKTCSDGFKKPGPAIDDDGNINPAVQEGVDAIKDVIDGLKKEKGALKNACDCELGDTGGETSSTSISQLIQGHVDKLNEISMKRMKATSNFRNSSSNF